MKAEILIQNKDEIYIPVVLEDITYNVERFGAPSSLTFKVIKDDVLNITEGNSVSFKWDGTEIFFGYIFSMRRDKEQIVSITAYDQLRYLKNKDTYVYENKTATEVIHMIIKDFNLKAGSIEDTGFKIASRVEDNQTLFDIIGNALDLTMENKKEIYVLYDDFGKITLKSLENMKLDYILDNETAENFHYTSDINENTYNKIKLVFDNKETGKRDVYIAQSGDNINNWGILQYYDTIQEGENGKAKADALLSLYNQRTRSLSIKKALGDTRVRGGSLLCISLDLGDTALNNYMLVESCKHIFSLDEHWMDLRVRGGEFVG